MLDVSDDEFLAYKAALRFAPSPSSVKAEEVNQILFLQQKKRDAELRSNQPRVKGALAAKKRAQMNQA